MQSKSVDIEGLGGSKMAKWSVVMTHQETTPLLKKCHEILVRTEHATPWKIRIGLKVLFLSSLNSQPIFKIICNNQAIAPIPPPESIHIAFWPYISLSLNCYCSCSKLLLMTSFRKWRCSGCLCHSWRVAGLQLRCNSRKAFLRGLHSQLPHGQGHLYNWILRWKPWSVCHHNR